MQYKYFVEAGASPIAFEKIFCNLVFMVSLHELVSYCNERVQTKEISDFPGSFNGLQIEKKGEIAKIGAAVDAGLAPFKKAKEQGIDFLVVHHGLFWNPPIPLTGKNYHKISYCIENNLAVYSSHLPLDCHPEIGNNAIMCKELGFKRLGGFLDYDGQDIGLVAQTDLSREQLKSRLLKLFPLGIKSIEFGKEIPGKIAILSGSGQSAVDKISEIGIDTLITGELKQQHFNFAQENDLNLYVCGHYATETFGVDALGRELADRFDLPYSFIDTACPL